jgi:bacteriorhodopsin
MTSSYVPRTPPSFLQGLGPRHAMARVPWHFVYAAMFLTFASAEDSEEADSDMRLINLHSAFQGFIIMVTAGGFIFFALEYCKKRATWEILWVSAVEAVVYTIAVFAPEEYAPTYGPAEVPMIRYMSWMLTCPVLIKVMLYTVCETPDLVRNNKLVIADIFMNAMGIMACLYDQMVLKMALFLIGMLAAVYIIRGVMREWSESRLILDQPVERACMLALMLVSWSIFPILFLAGPEGFKGISHEDSVLGHSIGDLIAKNFFSLMAWRVQIRSTAIKRRAQKVKEAAELEKLE